MNASRKAQALFDRMSAIKRMERGKLCRLAGRNHYNLQAWHKGRNEVRYVRAEEREAVQEAIDGYRLFKNLVQQYVDEVVKQTREEHHGKTRNRKQRTTESKT